jgi:hypothetical protein
MPGRRKLEKRLRFEPPQFLFPDQFPLRDEPLLPPDQFPLRDEPLLPPDQFPPRDEPLLPADPFPRAAAIALSPPRFED